MGMLVMVVVEVVVGCGGGGGGSGGGGGGRGVHVTRSIWPQSCHLEHQVSAWLM